VGAQVLLGSGVSLERVRGEVVTLLGSLAGEAEEVSVGTPRHEEPLCPKCRARVSETAAYRTLDVSSVEGEPRAVTFAFCRSCGTWLGTLA